MMRLYSPSHFLFNNRELTELMGEKMKLTLSCNQLILLVSIVLGYSFSPSKWGRML